MLMDDNGLICFSLTSDVTGLYVIDFLLIRLLFSLKEKAGGTG